MFSRFFIDRPVLTIVISLLIIFSGALSILTMTVEQYPDIAPPGVTVTANYTGASAETVQNSVTQVIEQQIKGIDGLLYFYSTSSAAGQARIILSFAQETDPDIAQVQVQNAVNQALTRLPQEVQQQGITVTKSQGDSLMVVGLYDETDAMSSVDISDFLVSHFQDPLSRVDGVGETTVFGAQYAMRIWMDPVKLHSLGLMPSDIQTAVEAQNAQVTSGELGALPAPENQAMTATVTTQSRLQTVSQFNNILLRTNRDGTKVLLKDVARVELGAENYQNQTRLNGHPSSGISIQLSSGANALATAENVKAEVARLSHLLPSGMKVAYPRDSTPFVTVSIEKVIETLIEAIILVVLVMYLFLQNWRATLIPAVTVPVVLLGTFGLLAAFGYSINTLTLFAMVLAIGLLVDDAIVVVENIERIMSDEGKSPREATLQSVNEITGALFGIALVLSAVFIPMSFFGGSVGIIYRQFTFTIVAAMALSVFVAMTLTPTLCALFLTPQNHRAPRLFRYFNQAIDAGQKSYLKSVGYVLRRPLIFLGLAGVLVFILLFSYTRLPTSFLPVEDQGSVMLQISAPTAYTMADTQRAADEVARYFMEEEKDNLNVVFMVVGRNNAGSGQNVAMAFAELKHWDLRSGSENTAQAIIARANQHFRHFGDVSVSVLSPPAVRGLGQSSGFELWLQDQSGVGGDNLISAQQKVLAQSQQDPKLTAVRINGLDAKAQLHIDIDHDKATAQGLTQSDITATLSSAWGGTYINDFLDRGRVKRVYMQGDMQWRSVPEDIEQWYVRGDDDQMVSFATFVNSHWVTGPQMLQRFNGVAAVPFLGSAAEGESSGTAMTQMQTIISQLDGFTLAWSGLSYQEIASSGQTLYIYVLSTIFIFLCLAALYESWSVPLAVILIIPLGILGAVLATSAFSFDNDIYFQVGMLTTMGLTAKNAILIVEFAQAQMNAGSPMLRAILSSALLRLRPVVMTSLAFIAGAVPLVISTGAGAISRQEIGVAVVGGMFAGTVLSLAYVPLFYVLILRAVIWCKARFSPS